MKRLRIKKYNPQQPRDSRGRWGTGSTNKPKTRYTPDNITERQKPLLDKLQDYVEQWSGKVANPNGIDTQQRYKDAEGNYTPERAEMHRLMVDFFLAGGDPVDKPVAHLMGGGPAAGKSTLIKSGKIPDLPIGNQVLVNPDEVKELLPEYLRAKELLDPTLSTQVHEESSEIAKMVLAEAQKQSKNILFDGSGNTSFEKVSKVAKTLAATGSRVHAHYVTCPIEVAHQRNEERFLNTGRKCPYSYLQETHENVSKVVSKAISAGIFDTLTVHDNHNETGEIQLLAEAKGTDYKIVNQKLWDRFMSLGSTAKNLKQPEMLDQVIAYTLGVDVTGMPARLKAEIDFIKSHGGIVLTPSEWV